MGGVCVLRRVMTAGNSEVGILMFSAAALWAILVIVQIVSVQKVLIVFRSSGKQATCH